VDGAAISKGEKAEISSCAFFFCSLYTTCCFLPTCVFRLGNKFASRIYGITTKKLALKHISEAAMPGVISWLNTIAHNAVITVPVCNGMIMGNATALVKFAATMVRWFERGVNQGLLPMTISR
jgi:hypothetical protein